MSLIVKGPGRNQDDEQLLEEMAGMNLLSGEQEFVDSVTDWFEERGFLTDRQRDALDAIYARAETRG